MNSLAARALTDLVKKTLMFGLLLFVPAFSLDFWEAWAFLTLFFSTNLLITIYFLKNDPDLVGRRLKWGPAAENRARQKVIMSLVKLSVASLMVVAGFDHRFSWSHVAAFPVIAADAAVLLGFLIQFRAFKENSFASAVVVIVPQQRLISTGPYAAVRHPMYVGALVVNFFTPVALGSWWALPFALAWLIVIRLRLLDEEDLLRQSLPGYEEYCQKVQHRLIPYIW